VIENGEVVVVGGERAGCVSEMVCGRLYEPQSKTDLAPTARSDHFDLWIVDMPS
jgi:hypothetical protein